MDDTDQMNRPEAMIGTGPFIWKEQIALQVMRMVRNPDWFGWDEPELDRPYVDGYESLFIYDDASIEAAFRTKKLDSAFQVSNAQWVVDLRQQEPGLISVDSGFSAWVKANVHRRPASLQRSSGCARPSTWPPTVARSSMPSGRATGARRGR